MPKAGVRSKSGTPVLSDFASEDGTPIVVDTATSKAYVLDDTNSVTAIKGSDTPQFTSIELGHASDTTLTRVSAGVIAVEGSNVLLASGLGSVTQAYDADIPTEIISQADAEAGTSTVSKAWTAERVAQAIAALGGTTKLGTKGVGVLKAGGINIVQNATRYLGCIGEAASASVAGCWVRVPKPTRVSELRVKLSAAVAGGESIVITAQINSKDTALTCTVTAGNTTAEDTTHSFDMKEGEWISFKAVTSATFGSTTDLGLSVKLVGEDDSGVGLIPYRGGASTTYEYTELNAPAAVGLSSILTDLCMPACKLMFAVFSNGISPNVRLNDVVPGTSEYIYPGCIEHRTFAANDLYNCVDATAQTDGILAVSMEADDYDYYAPCPIVFTSYSQAQNTTRYAGGYGSGDASATESDVQFPMPACTVKNLRVCSNTVVAAGQNTVVTIRKNGADTGVTCTLTNASRISSDLTNSVAFDAGDLLTVSVVSSATAGTHTYNILFETEETP